MLEGGSGVLGRGGERWEQSSCRGTRSSSILEETWARSQRGMNEGAARGFTEKGVEDDGASQVDQYEDRRDCNVEEERLDWNDKGGVDATEAERIRSAHAFLGMLEPEALTLGSLGSPCRAPSTKRCENWRTGFRCEGGASSVSTRGSNATRKLTPWQGRGRASSAAYRTSLLAVPRRSAQRRQQSFLRRASPGTHLEDDHERRKGSND